MNILQALDDKNLLGAGIRNPASWTAWKSLLAAMFGLPMPPPPFIASVRAAPSLPERNRR
jgi:hypothetical protein